MDSLQFAKNGGRLDGELQADDMPRLADMLPADSPAARFRLAGVVDAGRPALRLELRARVLLVCQRCLAPYVEELVVERTYPVARDESELARWERDEPLLEGLVAEPKLVLAELVEDEILLSLPTVPRHPEGECEPDTVARLQ